MSGKSLPPSERSGPEVALLRVGQPVDGIYACVRKERQLSRSGTPYLAAELRDATGLIAARAFRDADVLAGRFERGDLVRVRGLVKDWGGRPQVELRSIERVDAATVDPASFLPASRRDLDELEGFLEHLAREVFDPPLAALLRALLGDRKLRAELRRAPCTMPPSRSDGGGGAPRAGTHHAYLGGLLEHTVAVATLAVELCAVHTRLDRDMLLTAAIVHDLGRTREFTYGAEIGRTDAGRMLGHITLGLRVVGEHAPASLEDQRRLALEHCVMLHHGEDPAAGRRFASAEAVALHRLNALDAQVKGALEGAVAR